MDVLSSAPDGRPCHDALCRLRHEIDEGGVATVSSYSSFWRVGCRRVLGCSIDRSESCLGRRGLILPETSRGPRGTVQQENCGGGSADFLAQAMSARDASSAPFSVFDRAKRKCGQCPHFRPRTASYSRRIASDSACFHHFPVLPRPGIPFESHLGHGISPLRRGFLL